jgi:tRNA G37 N-methylase Trm5
MIFWIHDDSSSTLVELAKCFSAKFLNAVAHSFEDRTDMNVAILGASSNLERYSNKAQLRLMEEGHTVFPVSKKDEMIAGVKAYPNLAAIFGEIDTLTIYVRPSILTFKKNSQRQGFKFKSLALLYFLTPNSSST